MFAARTVRAAAAARHRGASHITAAAAAYHLARAFFRISHTVFHHQSAAEGGIAPVSDIPDESLEDQQDFASLLQQVSVLPHDLILYARLPSSIPNASHSLSQLRIEPSQPEESEAKFTIFTA